MVSWYLEYFLQTAIFTAAKGSNRIIVSRCYLRINTIGTNTATSRHGFINESPKCSTVGEGVSDQWAVLTLTASADARARAHTSCFQAHGGSVGGGTQARTVVILCGLSSW